MYPESPELPRGERVGNSQGNVYLLTISFRSCFALDRSEACTGRDGFITREMLGSRYDR